MDIKESLTFDDVLLVPKKAIVTSRKDISLKTRLSKNIPLHIPIISANMDTVTESAMAITLAKMGGLGIIHRFLSIEQQVNAQYPNLPEANKQALVQQELERIYAIFVYCKF